MAWHGIAANDVYDNFIYDFVQIKWHKIVQINYHVELSILYMFGLAPIKLNKNILLSLIKNAPDPTILSNFFYMRYNEFVIYMCVCVCLFVCGMSERMEIKTEMKTKDTKRHERVEMGVDKKFSNLDQLGECKRNRIE